MSVDDYNCHACGTPAPRCIGQPVPCCEECLHGSAMRHHAFGDLAALIEASSLGADEVKAARAEGHESLIDRLAQAEAKVRELQALLDLNDTLHRLMTNDGADRIDDRLAVAAHYFSTYCVHDRHDECRRSCKTCSAPCRCACHRPGGDVE